VPDAVDTVVCAPDDEWRYQTKYVEQFSRNKLCNVASCWIYIRIFLALARSLSTVVHVTCSVSLSMKVTVTDGRMRHSGVTLSYNSVGRKRNVVYKCLKLRSNILSRFTERKRSHFAARLGSTVCAKQYQQTKS